ncbi:MAG: glycosyl hydrolase family 95 catalytic domain-containing protein, partial [Candidatus Hinthialibacter sp.]
SEAVTWRKVLSEWPDLARSEEDGRLLVAPGYPLKESHRHFSHLMAIHPLGLIDVSNGEEDQKTIAGALEELERLGPDYWCGYSYAWLASLCARAGDGEKAAQALRTFAQCFCSINTFHLNGDQTQSGKSKFTYRPFTLEGNFAFAAGVQKMLLQSHTGLIRVFPAIPGEWNDASFQTLRAEGAFLISAVRKNGRVQSLEILPEKGGLLRLQSPFEPKAYRFYGVKKSDIYEKDDVIEIETHPGRKIILTAN